jgi:hypothetical protein
MKNAIRSKTTGKYIQMQKECFFLNVRKNMKNKKGKTIL